MSEKLATTLLNMAAADQSMLHQGLQTGSWDESLYRTHAEQLKDIVNAHGWPTIMAIGEKATAAAWLLIQHADHDPDFQARCLELMKQLPEDQVSLRHIAYLEDRVRINFGRPQLYGTQPRNDGVHPGWWPIEDRENLDKRRRAMRLIPFAEYEAQVKAATRKRQYQRILSAMSFRLASIRRHQE